MKKSFKIGMILLLIISLGIGGFFLWYNMESKEKNIYNEKYSSVLNKNRYDYIKEDYNIILDVVKMIKTQDYTKEEIRQVARKTIQMNKPIVSESKREALRLSNTLNKISYNFYVMVYKSEMEDTLGIEYILLDEINKKFMNELNEYLDEWMVYDLKLSTEDYKYLFETCMVK